MGRQAIARSRVATLAAASLLAVACAEPTPPGGDPIEREVFIEAYVELRLAALGADDFVVPTQERDEILARHGIDQQRLLRFAEVHGEDVELMNEVWAEVERRLEDRRPSDDANP